MVVYYSCATYRIVIGICIPAPRIFPFMTSQTSQDTSNKFNALGEKSIPKLLVQYSLPAIIAMVVSSLYNIIDGIFIGQAVGADAISGLALTNPLMAISAAFGAMVGIGGSTLMSIRLGQKDYKAAHAILGNVIVLNVVIGLTLGLVLELNLDAILRLFGASDRTLPYARAYMQILLFGNAFTHMYYGLNAQLRSTSRPIYAMYANIGTVAINTVLAYLFVVRLGWGIAGAAWSTLIAQMCALCWQFWLFSRKDSPVRLLRRYLRPQVRIMKEVLTIGLPQFLINTTTSLVAITIMRSMAEYGGDTAVGAYGIVNRLAMFMAFVVMGLDQGMLPIAGYNFGAQKFHRLESVVKYTLVAATVVTTLSFAASHLFPGALVGLFVKDAPELAAAGEHGLRVVSLFWPVIGMQIVSSAFFQSIGSPAKSIFLSLTRQLIFLIPLVLTLPRILPNFLSGAAPIDVVWYSLPAADGVAALISAVMLVAQIRKLRQKSAERL